MAQKSHPNIIRPKRSPSQGSTHWNEARLYYLTSNIHKRIETCCSETSMYMDKTEVNLHFGHLHIETHLIQFRIKGKRRFLSRRYKENIVKYTLDSMPLVTSKILKELPEIQHMTGTKKLTIKINRLKAYTRAVPRPARKQLKWFNKSYNRFKYNYARYGMQLISLFLKKKASPASLSRFLKTNIYSKQRRKRHYHFLGYLKQTFRALQEFKKIKGLKILIKGRFAHKAKGRSRTWKYHIGPMPLNKFDTNIHAEYTETQTVYGSVGIKVWLYLEDENTT